MSEKDKKSVAKKEASRHMDGDRKGRKKNVRVLTKKER